MAMTDFSFFSSGAELSAPEPAIYCLATLDPRCIYIGQTNCSSGVLGRFSQHLSETNSNTFRQRISSLYCLDEYKQGNTFGVFFPLPKKSTFQSRASDYREAVEGLVQSQIIKYAAQKKFVVVSRVSKNALCNQREIQELSSAATHRFICFLDSLDFSECN